MNNRLRTGCRLLAGLPSRRGDLPRRPPPGTATWLDLGARKVGARAALLPVDRRVEGLLEGPRGQSRLTAVRSITLIVSTYDASLGSRAHEGIGKLIAHAHPHQLRK